MAQISIILKQFSRDTFSSLHIRNYRLYYLGQIISTSGTFMQSVAQAWLVLNLTHSGTALGIVTALQYLPVLLFGALGGIAADRFSKRKVLFFTQSISGILAIILGGLVATGTVTLWMVFGLAFGLGMVSVFDNPTRQTFVIEMVGTEQVRNAVTLYSSLVNLSRIIGPAIAAALISTVGLAPCFLINGISYAAVVVMLAMMRSEELHPALPAPREKGQLRAGFDYMRSTPVLAATLLMMAIIGTLTFEFQVSLPLIAQFTFKGDASSYAFLTGAMGVGAVFGGLVMASRKEVVPAKLAGAAVLFGVTVLAAAFMPTLALVGAGMVLVGIFSISFTTLGNSVLQLNSSPQMRGRVMSFWSIAFLGSTTIGGPIVGWFAGLAGPRWGLALGGIAALVAAAIGALALRSAQGEKAVTKEGSHSVG
ncbi:MAG TPA: MFS transporter [Anaerolineaceae bacterium]